MSIEPSDVITGSNCSLQKKGTKQQIWYCFGLGLYMTYMTFT